MRCCGPDHRACSSPRRPAHVEEPTLTSVPAHYPTAPSSDLPRAGGIDNRSPVPKYYQLREILLDLIENELGVDAPVPSERERATRYGLSRMTARQAVEHLVSEGRLYRVQG